MMEPVAELCDDCQTEGASLKATLTKHSGEVLDSVKLCYGCAYTRRFHAGLQSDQLAPRRTGPHFMF